MALSEPVVEAAERALAAYDTGAHAPVEPVSVGLMHATFFVATARGPLVFQRLHAKLATAAILADYAAVTSHLAARGVPAPRLVPTRAGAWIAEDPTGAWWRLTTRVPGETRARVTHPDEAHEGARALGRFHRAMADLDHTFRSRHPLHDTAAHLAGLRAAAANPALATHRAPLAAEIATLEDTLPALLLDPALPRRVVHGDPKISNILFVGDAASALIDLDTCNRHSVLVDLGDAVRSWCRDGAEDEQERFHLDRFAAVLAGYADSGLTLTPAEVAGLAGAGRLITLELAARFARDALEDEYFGYDATRYPDRRSHNVARTRAMLHLAADMARQMPAMEALVADHFGRG
jgi:Ser/Thr protein kinase RdoA (MazF antagonist)